MKVLVFNRMTDFFNVAKLKLENHFFEMITATVSHDMRTPINSILGISEVLENYISNEKGKYLISIV